MPRLEPVPFNPFPSDNTDSGMRLEPVPFNPFPDEGLGSMAQPTEGDTALQSIGKGLAKEAVRIRSLPARAVGTARELGHAVLGITPARAEEAGAATELTSQEVEAARAQVPMHEGPRVVPGQFGRGEEPNFAPVPAAELEREREENVGAALAVKQREALTEELARPSREKVKAYEDLMEQYAPSPGTPAYNKFINDAASVVLQALQLVGVGAIAGPQTALALLTTDAFTQSYMSDRMKGLSRKESTKLATIDALAERAFEGVPLGEALRKGAPFVQRLLRTAGTETVQETATSIVQTANDAVGRGEDITLADAAKRVMYEGALGTVGGAAMAPIGHAAAKVAEKRQGRKTTETPSDRLAPEEAVTVEQESLVQADPLAAPTPEGIKVSEKESLPKELPTALPAQTVPQVEDATDATGDRVNEFLNRGIQRFQMEEQGQFILDEMDAAQESPRSVSDKFWTDVYPQLNAKGQRRFQRSLKNLTGFEPGSVTAVYSDGREEVASDWQDVANAWSSDAPETADYLEGTERGYIALMKWANEKAKEAPASEVEAVGRGERDRVNEFQAAEKALQDVQQALVVETPPAEAPTEPLTLEAHTKADLRARETPPAPTIYRAHRGKESGPPKAWQSWAETEETAERYTEEGVGHGGQNLRTYPINLTDYDVLDVDVDSKQGFERLASDLGYENAQEEAGRWWGNGWRYPWEESAKVKARMEESGYDFIRYEDDYPDGAITVVPLRDIEASATEIEVKEETKEEPRYPKHSIRAYHGSPHQFDKFTTEKIGEGEGAQAFGYGLYFADEPGVGEAYRRSLTGTMPGAFSGKSDYIIKGVGFPEGRSGHSALDLYGDINQVLVLRKTSPETGMLPFLDQQIEQRIKRWEEHGTKTGAAGEHMQALVDFWRQHAKKATAEEIVPVPKGALYEVKLEWPEVREAAETAKKPLSREDFLDFDALLSQQSEKIQNAASQAYEYRYGRSPRWASWATGRDILNALSGGGMQTYGPEADAANKKASEALEKAGIPGIAYLDQGSRAEGKGTYNYVVFDENLIEIINAQKFSKKKQTEPARMSADQARQALASRFGEKLISSLEKLGFSIVEREADLSETLRHPEGGTQGVYDPKTNRSYLVAENLAPETAEGVLLHEVGVHQGLQNLLGDEVYGLALAELQRMRNAGHKGVRAAYARVPSETARENVAEEALAYLVEDPGNRQIPIVRRILAAIRQWMFRHGYTGKLTPEAIVEMVRAAVRRQSRGEVTQREELEMLREQAPRVPRGTLKGKPTGAFTERQAFSHIDPKTAAFKRWFEGSKVVDDRGKPLTVYHGTDRDFKHFRVRDLGYHFGTLEQAERVLHGKTAFPRDYIGGENIRPVYLAIKNPLRTTDAANWESPVAVINAIPDDALPENIWKKLDVISGQEVTTRREINSAIREIRNLLESAGYDGVVYKNKVEGKGDSWIAFHSSQIKSAIVERQAFSAVGQTFYSPTLKAVRDMRQPKAPPAQWLAMLRKTPGVKAEEIEWLGLEEWMEGQKSITREELEAFVAAHEIKVEERVRDDSAEREDVSELEDRYIERRMGSLSIDFKEELDGYVIRDESGDAFSEAGGRGPISWDTLAEAEKELTFAVYSEAENMSREDLENALDAFDVEYSTTQYSDRQLPGGERYRELLLTLPPGRADYPSTKAKEETFISQHFDEPNILAHVRFNERTDADGNRVLFIEEIQSDWHQKGRDVGYKSKRVIDKINVEQGKLYARIEKHGEANTKEEQEKYWALQDRKIKLNREGIADAPFKTTWPLLAFKRMIRWAAENDFDAIAWTTGEQQADRYDLSKQVKEIHVAPTAKETAWNISLRMLDGQLVDHGTHKTEELPNVVGKELAKKITDGEGEKSGDWRIFRGVDLKVGGEGMRTFYDKMLLAMVNKYVKKWDGKVEPGLVEGIPGGARHEVHSLAVTPEMRNAALAGQPLFSLKAIANDIRGIVAQRKQIRGEKERNLIDRYYKALIAEDADEIYHEMMGKDVVKGQRIAEEGRKKETPRAERALEQIPKSQRREIAS